MQVLAQGKMGCHVPRLAKLACTKFGRVRFPHVPHVLEIYGDYSVTEQKCVALFFVKEAVGVRFSIITPTRRY